MESDEEAAAAARDEGGGSGGAEDGKPPHVHEAALRAAQEALQPPAFPWEARCHVLVACVYMMAVAGMSRAFGTYSDTLMTQLDYTEAQVDLLAAFNSLGRCIFGIIAGAFVDYVGYLLAALVGAVMCFVGFLLIWGAVAGYYSVPFGAMVVFDFIAYGGTQWLVIVAMIGVLRNYPDIKGPAAALIRSMFSVSSSMYGQMNATLFQDSAHLLIAIAMLAVIVVVPAAPFVHTLPNQGRLRKRHKYFADQTTVYFGLAVVGAILVVIVISLFCEAYLNLSKAARAIILVVLFALFVPFALIPPLNRHLRSLPEEEPVAFGKLDELEEEDPDEPLLKGGVTDGDYGSVHRDREVQGVRQRIVCGQPQGELQQMGIIERPLTTGEALSGPTPWVLFVLSVVSYGGALMIDDNLSQIIYVYGASNSSVYVSWGGVFMALGKAGGGMAADYLYRTFGMPRLSIWSGAYAIMALGYILLLFVYTQWMLFIGQALIDLVSGLHNALLPVLLSEYYGTKHLGLLYGVVDFSLAVADFGLSYGMFSHLYQHYNNDDDDDGHCTDKLCTAVSFLVMLVLVVLALALSAGYTVYLLPVSRRVLRWTRRRLAALEGAGGIAMSAR